MTAIESSLEIFKKACLSAENYVENFFRKEDESDATVLPEDDLKVLGVIHNMGENAGIKDVESLHILHIYLRSRPDLAIKTGKNNVIYRVNHIRVKNKLLPEDCSMKHYELVKELASNMIEYELKALEASHPCIKARLSIQDLAATMANKLNIKSYAAYYCIKKYLKEERSHDLVITRGRQGGIMRIKLM